jgi:transcriptional regulator with XRE-family HTH domain
VTVGQEIRRQREERGWSQAKLGVLSGTGPSGISQIETGRRNPSAATLQRIAEALDVGIADLFPKGQAPLPEFPEERREAASDVALDAARRQREHNRKAINRTHASQGIRQPSYFAEYENAAIQRLSGYLPAELAPAVMELAQRAVQLEERVVQLEERVVQLEEQVERTSKASSEEAKIRSASA